MEIRVFLAVWGSSARYWKKFFWEFSHLDKVCFEADLQLLLIQYPAELHIIQVDNAPAHNLGSSLLTMPN
jgi:hypothetical protein